MTILWLAFSGTAVVAIFACVEVYKLRKQYRQLEQSTADKVQKLQKELDMVNSAAVGVGQRLIQLEKKLKLSIDRQQQMELLNPDHTTYTEAASLAEQGAEVEQLIDRYGLPEAEASLLTLLKNAGGKSG